MKSDFLLFAKGESLHPWKPWLVELLSLLRIVPPFLKQLEMQVCKSIHIILRNWSIKWGDDSVLKTSENHIFKEDLTMWHFIHRKMQGGKC